MRIVCPLTTCRRPLALAGVFFTLAIVPVSFGENIVGSSPLPQARTLLALSGSRPVKTLLQCLVRTANIRKCLKKVLNKDPPPMTSCSEGFEWDEDTGVCEDIDECEGSNPCGIDATCANTKGSFACICGNGLYGDPMTECIGLPVFDVKGVDSSTFNPRGGPVCIELSNAAFDQDPSTVTLHLNNDTVSSAHISIEPQEICADETLPDGLVQLSLVAQDASSGSPLEFQEYFWAGSATVNIALVDSLGNPYLKEAIIEAKVAEEKGITATKTTNTGSIQFNNLPARTIIFGAAGEEGESGFSGAIAGIETSKTIELIGFLPTSDIDNNDFSQELLGWEDSKANYAAIVAHEEDVGPPGGNSETRRALDQDNDLVLGTGGVLGPSTISRTFTIKSSVSGVRVRYRFKTREYPNYIGSAYNDYFRLTIRSKKFGRGISVSNSLNGLGSSAFDNLGSTKWKDVRLPTSLNGDEVQVDLVVANVGDASHDSFVYVDIVQELEQSMCIYSKEAIGVGSPSLDAGHAAILFADTKTSPHTVKTWGLWPDNIEWEELGIDLDNGDGTDVRTDLIADTPDLRLFKYFYCEPLTDIQKVKVLLLDDREEDWTCTFNCASFASDVFREITDTLVDPDDLLGIETPRKLGESIRRLNGNRDLPPEGLPFVVEPDWSERKLVAVPPVVIIFASSFVLGFLKINCGYF